MRRRAEPRQRRRLRHGGSAEYEPGRYASGLHDVDDRRSLPRLQVERVLGPRRQHAAQQSVGRFLRCDASKAGRISGRRLHVQLGRYRPHARSGRHDRIRKPYEFGVHAIDAAHQLSGRRRRSGLEHLRTAVAVQSDRVYRYQHDGLLYGPCQLDVARDPAEQHHCRWIPVRSRRYLHHVVRRREVHAVPYAVPAVHRDPGRYGNQRRQLRRRKDRQPSDRYADRCDV